MSDCASPAVNLTIEDGKEVERLVDAAKQCLQLILSASEHPDLVRALSLLPHLAKDPTLRREIVVGCGVSSALIRLLRWSVKNSRDSTLTLVVDSICHLLQMGVYGSPHLTRVLISGAAELQYTMAALLTAKPESGQPGGLDILSKLLETDGNSVLLLIYSIDMHCAESSLVLAALRIIVLLPRDRDGADFL